MKTITFEQLAEKLNGKIWTKGDLKRIYLDRGYNTKKMSTKTYVEEVDGEFVVKCFIDCPSQAWNWIKSQQEEVIESVENEIEIAKEENVYVFQTPDGKFCNYKEKVETVGALYRFFETKKEADKEDQSDYAEGAVLVAVSKEEFRKSESEYYEKAKSETIDTKEEIAITKKTIAPAENSSNQEFGVGNKIMHSNFGIGTVVSEGDEKITVNFPSVGEKTMIKRFAKLTLVNE